MAALLLFGLTTVGCTKEKVVDDTVVVATITQTVSYVVDGIHYTANPQNDDEWSDFLDRMIALAEEGHTVQFWRNGIQNGDASKEVVTFTTTEGELAKEWAKKKKDEGYIVTIDYNPQTGEFTCIAIR